MSVVVVQLGQCGNQVGRELFEVVDSDARGQGAKADGERYREASLDRFFSCEESGGNVPTARAVLVDMESKVIGRTLSSAAKTGRWKYGDKNYFCQKKGSGNNWANGFYIHGPKCEDAVMNLVRQEVEKCDRLSGFITTMSLAGGTGSGLGTYVTGCLRDTYPNSFILNHVIWPHRTGEVIVQNYNSVLTLSHLYQSSDGLLIHENDTIHKICSQLLNIKQISFTDVNKVIAHQLGSILQPVCTGLCLTEYSRSPLGDLMETLVTHPEYKLLSAMSIPQMSDTSLAFSTFTWLGLMKHLRQMLISNTKMEEGGFNDQALYTSWTPAESALSVWQASQTFNKYERSATMVSNSQSVLKPLDSVVRKAWNMFASRAYVHQYTKYGIAEEDFLDSFTTMEQVVASYSNL
ncbi:tubulin delta chain isoform X2 [Callorhinchus milii]|uniref:tubulin delta chain isoform X2 n=1 Tax=Callorhinchus milii TaxID=7868 RepID=UPI001C3F7363|nr:tubulin delta chain isoform X2 [Callorhinchus milii]